MKKGLTALLHPAIALSTVALGLMQLPMQAQNILVTPKFPDIVYPRSSEEFFKQGRQQLEQEIQKLHQSPPATPLLTIDPTLEHQMPPISLPTLPKTPTPAAPQAQPSH
jgi:hypothetical protein